MQQGIVSIEAFWYDNSSHSFNFIHLRSLYFNEAKCDFGRDHGAVKLLTSMTICNSKEQKIQRQERVAS